MLISLISSLSLNIMRNVKLTSLFSRESRTNRAELGLKCMHACDVGLAQNKPMWMAITQLSEFYTEPENAVPMR